jgi:diaminohydroxyphosphoribosylaminopyrimidine deaminase/5-amino-6-(5-phosphoribosylamino)uracil reductase
MKVAMTLDGRIAPPVRLRDTREPYWISGEESRAAVQNLRHEADAVLTGIGTVLTDDPLLTDRSGQGRRRPLLRVILDSALRTPLESKIVRTAQRDVVIFTVSEDKARADELRSRGVRVEVLPPPSHRVSLPAVLEELGSEGILNLLTESGSRLNTAFLTENLIDRLRIFISPQLMGADAVPGFEDISHPISLSQVELQQYGNDISLSSLICDPWQKL